MNRLIFRALTAMLVLGCAASAAAAGVELTIRDGRVSLDAQDVTIRQILAEWARIGKTRIVNLERVNGGPVTLKFDGLPEDQALDIILRAVPGYMAAPRAEFAADASIYDRIVIMPTTTAVASTGPRLQPPATFSDSSGNVTQLRSGPPPLNPGMLPEPPDDARTLNDPAVAAAAAAGLTAIPAPAPTTLAPPSGPLQPPVRNAGTSTSSMPASPAPQTPGTGTVPGNPFNVPAGTSRPTLAPPVAPPSTTAPPPSRGAGTRPQQADQ